MAEFKNMVTDRDSNVLVQSQMNDTGEKIEEFVQMHGRTFKDAVDCHVALFIENITSMTTGMRISDSPECIVKGESPTFSDSYEYIKQLEDNLKRVEAELETALSLIFALRSGLQVSSTLLRNYLKK